MSEEAQNGNKEGASSDPRGIPAERQQEGWGGVVGVVSHALQKMPIKKLHFVLFSFLFLTLKSLNQSKPKDRSWDTKANPKSLIKTTKI